MQCHVKYFFGMDYNMAFWSLWNSDMLYNFRLLNSVTTKENTKQIYNDKILSLILLWEGVDTNMPGVLYKAVVQEVILFGSEKWVMTPCIAGTLGGFHHYMDRWLMVKQPRKEEDGNCRYPSLAAEIAEAGLEVLDNYVARRQNTVAQYIVTPTIMYLYMEAERFPGARVSKRW